jgi:hypothetical protein
MGDLPADGAHVTLRGSWPDAFGRLEERGGGVIRVPAGVHETGSARIDLAAYPSLGNGVVVRGEGLGTSVVHLGTGPGDGLTVADSEGGDRFYLEIRGVQFVGRREGVLVRLGRDDCADAYNSCTLAFATNNGHPDGTAACRLNQVLNSRHFGVHNAEGGVALQLRQFQFGGLTGSVSSTDAVSLELDGYSMANVVEWLNVEACTDGVRVAGADANVNRFGMLYGAHVSGTLWRHEADVSNRIDAAFVGDDVATVDERAAGEYTVGLSNQPFGHAGHREDG